MLARSPVGIFEFIFSGFVWCAKNQGEEAWEGGRKESRQERIGFPILNIFLFIGTLKCVSSNENHYHLKST